MALEVELKYAAADRGPLDRLAAVEAIGPARLGPPRTVDEVDVYLDTADGRFEAARWAVRLRRRERETRVSVKGPAEVHAGGAGLHRRPELEGPADGADPASWPPSEARNLVERLRAGRPLVARFTLRQRRTERAVTVRGAAVGTLSLDEVEVEEGGRPRGSLRAVELELRRPSDGDEDVVAELDAALRTVDGLVPEPRTKLEHALALLARS